MLEEDFIPPSTDDVFKNAAGESLFIPGLSACLAGEKSAEHSAWAQHLRRRDYNLNETMQMIQYDRSIWGVVSALIMTVGYSGVFISPTAQQPTGQSKTVISLVPTSSGAIPA